ncbi:MAG: DUF1963 domain-containing protein [Clostridia bacterium]|nr:DUF1963 domain-containing protein [Clostridia bacterium]
MFEQFALKKILKSLQKNQIRMDTAHRRVARPDESKLGGNPFLPVGFVWPTFTSKEDNVTRPLSFFCQINLQDITALDTDRMLPERGLLYFFYDTESFCWGFDPTDKGAVQVYYYENTEGFAPCALPPDVPEESTIPEIALQFTTEPSFPGFEEFECYSDLDVDWEDYDRVLAKLGIDPEAEDEKHKLLGYADLIQGEILTECERARRGLYSGDPESYQRTEADEAAAIHACAKDWVLLLQLSTICARDFEWMFGDCGSLYYYIRKEDLAARRFENAWFSVQCY